ncbi:histidinol dehydrogenase [Candidatus Nitronereus thalassa]|uniref:Histidinol dehydrogenase n=1 Tax=Candidatus Nitronereus thalassa TaxID=3020898 RepID=A0ABU3KAD0_9BACT|nr:histidinol dehydrogenase [Candidatus Nitronereus thalassa]MDT7043424.1 histidinol dehydrogenase [Candidatus Nitronereus thalassa]
MKIISSKDREFKKTLDQVCRRGSQQNAKIEGRVKQILQAVERGGDAAVCRYVKQFDGLRLTPRGIKVRREEIVHAYKYLSISERNSLRFAAKRIRSFHERQRTKTWVHTDKGVKLGQMITPLDVVGLYVPGGKALYPSTVLMNAIPAKVAGVGRVIMCTPTTSGEIHPYLLAAADIAGVDEIYRIGGVQAVGAMAYGTRTIPKTDKIVGPGNMYVAAAKRVVYGTVDIDMIAGPSELLVVADETANPLHCAADLLCEAEHDEEARVYLVTTSLRVAKAVVREVAKQLPKLSRKQIATHSVRQYAIAFVTSTMEQAFDVANAIAAEHLELLVKRPLEAVKKVRHAGAIFVGPHTPPAVADYVAGPNHVLPTGGSARFFSALSLDDFVKKTNIVMYNQKQLKEVQAHVTCLAGMEGLQAHARSIESRSE